MVLYLYIHLKWHIFEIYKNRTEFVQFFSNLYSYMESPFCRKIDNNFDLYKVNATFLWYFIIFNNETD